MGDHVRDPFDDIDSGDEEELEKPPTPEIHHGSASPDAPGFSDISDNEDEETSNEETVRQQPEDSNNSSSVNSPVEDEFNAKEDVLEEAKPNGSPLYDQEMSPVSPTSATADDQDNTSAKVEQEEEESSSVAEQTHAEKTVESERKQEYLEGSEVEGEVEISDQPSVPREETREGQSGGNSNDTENTTERRRTISSGAATDDDLEMPISPLGLGLSGPESEIVDDILKSDVSKLLPGNEDESKEGPLGILYINDTYILLDDLAYNMHRYFASCILFFRAL